MKCHNIAVYLIIPLALFSIMSLFDNVQAQTNSSSSANQTTSQQQQQQTTSAAQSTTTTPSTMNEVDFNTNDCKLPASYCLLEDGKPTDKPISKDVVDFEERSTFLLFA